MSELTAIALERRRNVVLYFVCVFAIVVCSAQLFEIRYPPLIDNPNHLARHAIECGVFGGVGMAGFYDFDLTLVPNMLSDLVYSFQLPCSDIFLTNKILIQISILNLVAAVLCLHYALWRKLSVWPMMSCLTAYNMSFSFGFENFVLSSPLSLYLLSFWILRRDHRGSYWIVCVSTAALYVFHIVSFGFFMILFAGWEVGRFLRHRPASGALPGFVRAAFVAVGPAIVPFAHFIFMAAGGEQEHGTGSLLDLRSRLSAAYSIFTPLLFSDLTAREVALHGATAAFVAGAVVWAVVRGRLRIAEGMTAPLAFAALAALLAPSVFGGVSFIHVRYPFLAVALFFAATDLTVRFRYRAILAALTLGLFATRTAEALTVWRAHDRQVAELVSEFSDVPKTALILTAYVEKNAAVSRHSHSLAHVGISGGFFIHTLFHGANTLRPKEAYRALTHPQYFPVPISRLIEEFQQHTRGDLAPTEDYLSLWPENFSHILLLGDPDDLQQLAGLPGRRVGEGSFYWLLELPN